MIYESMKESLKCLHNLIPEFQSLLIIITNLILFLIGENTYKVRLLKFFTIV